MKLTEFLSEEILTLEVSSPWLRGGYCNKKNNCATYGWVECGTSIVSFHFAEIKYSYFVVMNVHNEYGVYVLLFPYGY